MSVDLPAIAILGAGSMGGAILSGLTAPGVHVDGGIRVTNRTRSKADALVGPGVQSFAIETDANANTRALDGARIVIIGVKPAMVAGLLRDIRNDLADDAIVVSVAAGVPIAAMESIVDVAVIRAMPNTPAVVGRAVTGLSAGTRSGDADLDIVTRLFATVGEVLVLPESSIDALGTISGSGPAYVFYLIEQLTATAERMGFTPAVASTMVTQTFLGAAELLVESGETPQELRRRVTSPNGTTERAIAELERADLGGIFDRATAAALARSRELAGG